MWCHDEAFVVLVIINRLLLELAHATDELLHANWCMDDAIRFVDGWELALALVAHGGWSMLLVELCLVTSSWACFLGLDEGLEVRLDEEVCPCALAKISDVEFTPIHRLGIMKT